RPARRDARLACTPLEERALLSTVITIYPNPQAVAESAGHAGLSVGITGTTPAGPVSVDYRTVDGQARAGADYTATSGTAVRTSANGWHVQVDVPITNDTL